MVKALFELKGLKAARVARKKNINVRTFHCTLSGHRRHPGTCTAISRALGIPTSELFPPKNGDGR